MNSVNLVGRLTRDVELKYTSGGTAVAGGSLAVNRMKKDDPADFIDITIWGKMAEGLTQYLVKGKQIAVSGRFQQDRWEKDGQKRSKIKVVAERIDLLGSKSDGKQSGNSGGFGNQDGDKQYDEQYGGPENFEDDIPF